MLAMLTAAVAAALVAVGLGYLVHRGPDEATLVQSVPHATGSGVTPLGATAGTPARGKPSLAPGLGVTLTARPTPTRTPTPTPTATASPTPEPPPVLDFVISSFNVLGSSHTSGKGKRPGMASGRTRAARAADLLARHQADVIGFQELQGDQLAALRRHTDLDFYPGSSLRRRDSENSLGWQRSEWTAVEKHTVAIPYFNGNRRPMPYVRLRNTATGLEAWFANFHNPADTRQFHRQQGFRSRATSIEIALANRLVRTGLPVFITGDMNERDEYFCALTAGAPMVAARGGSNNGACRAGNPRAVDWIFGSQDVAFSDYVEDRSRLVGITTDHPVVSARARIVGEAGGTGEAGGPAVTSSPTSDD